MCVSAALFSACGAQDSGPSVSDPPFQLDLDDTPSPESIERIRGAERRLIGRLREAARFRQPEDGSFIEIVQTQVEPQSGRLFGFDHNTAHIYELAPDLTIRRRLVAGKGDGPGEMLNPGWFAVDDEGRYHIPDVYGRTLEIFGPDGAHLRSVPLGFQPVNVGSDGGSLYIYGPTEGGMFLEYRIEDLLSSEEAEPVRQFGDFKLGFSAGRFMLMFGQVAFRKSRLVYVPAYIPIFYIVDLDAETMRVFPTIDYLVFDQQDEPEVETGESGMAVMRPPNTRASSLRFVSADTAFVMSTFTHTEERTWLDAYMMTSGEYVGSIELNVNLRSMSGGPTSIMVSTQDGELIRFDRLSDVDGLKK